jgi:hypothetical protein
MKVLTAPRVELPRGDVAASDLPTETHTDVEAWRARIDAKRAEAARRRALDAAAAAAPARPLPRALRVKPAPKPPRTPRVAASKPVRERPPAVRPCVKCQHPTRPANARLDEYPGTRRRRAGGVCDPCHTGRPPRAERQPKARTARPPAVRPCTDCGRLTRPGGSTAEQHPGTLVRANGGQCHTCANGGPRPRPERAPRAAREPRPARPIVRPCVTCGRPTRPSSRTLTEFPDTVKRNTADQCQRCTYTPRPVRAARVPIAELVRLYVDLNLGSAEVGRRVGMSGQAVIYNLRAAGIPIRSQGHPVTRRLGSTPKTYDPALVDRIRQLAADGLTQPEIAEQTGTSRKVVWRVMARHDIRALPQVAREPRDGAVHLKAHMAAAGVTSAQVRAWANATGLTIAARGLPPAAVLDAYLTAHQPAEASA